MSTFKILVEFELDPTEYAGKVSIDGEEVDSFETMPDTLESAKTLVEKMFAGEVEICKTRMIGDLLLLFRGRASAASIERQMMHQQVLIATIGTLQKFIQEKPFQKVTGPLSIVAQPPRIGTPYYDVSIWRQPVTGLTTDPEPLVTEV